MEGGKGGWRRSLGKECGGLTGLHSNGGHEEGEYELELHFGRQK